MSLKKKLNHNFFLCFFLLLTGCIGSNSKKSFNNKKTGATSSVNILSVNKSIESVSLRAPFDKKEEDLLLGGMSQQHAVSLLSVQEFGTQFADIAFPIGAYEIKKWAPLQNNYQLSYKSTRMPDFLADFYLSHMEHLGWKCIETFYAHEVLLVFAKPDKRCAISIRSQKIDLSIFVLISYLSS